MTVRGPLPASNDGCGLLFLDNAGLARDAEVRWSARRQRGLVEDPHSRYHGLVANGQGLARVFCCVHQVVICVRWGHGVRSRQTTTWRGRCSRIFLAAMFRRTPPAQPSPQREAEPTAAPHPSTASMTFLCWNTLALLERPTVCRLVKRGGIFTRILYFYPPQEHARKQEGGSPQD